MRILHVTSGLNMRSGGPVSALSSMARAQARAGCDVTVAAAFSEGEPPEVKSLLEQDHVRVELLGPTCGRLWLERDLRRELVQIVSAADVVHIHGLWEAIQHAAASAARKWKTSYVMTPHGMLSRWALSQSALKKRLYLMWRMRRHLDRASAVHFTSRKEQAELAISMAAPMLVEPLAIDLAEFQTDAERGGFRRRIGVSESAPLIVFLGRIHPGKGVEHLIPALAKMERKDAMAGIVGPDSEGYLAAMQGLASQHAIADRVIFTGPLQGAERVAALRDADLFALPSDHENFGMSVVEALAAGTPVVISDGVAVAPEIQAAGVGGVVKVKDIESLARELDRWLGNPTMREEAAKKSRDFVRLSYGLEASGRRWREHYEAILSAAKSK